MSDSEVNGRVTRPTFDDPEGVLMSDSEVNGRIKHPMIPREFELITIDSKSKTETN